MGTYTRKSKGIGELSVMEVARVGVRTRARALAMAAAAGNSRTVKRRKVSGGELRFSSSLSRLRSRRRMVIMRESSVSPATSGSSEQTVSNDRRSSYNSDLIFASCCSSNDASSDLAKERLVDLEDESAQNDQSACDFDCRQRRETTPSSGLQTESGDLESTARAASEANSRRRSSAGNMPSETELEAFFAAAEKELQKRFTERYNYDIVKDVPLEGRYDWVQLKP